MSRRWRQLSRRHPETTLACRDQVSPSVRPATKESPHFLVECGRMAVASNLTNLDKFADRGIHAATTGSSEGSQHADQESRRPTLRSSGHSPTVHECRRQSTPANFWEVFAAYGADDRENGYCPAEPGAAPESHALPCAYSRSIAALPGTVRSDVICAPPCDCT